MEVEYRSEMEGNKPFVIGINGKYLLDMLEAIDGEKVSIEMGNEFSPIKIEENSSVHASKIG